MAIRTIGALLLLGSFGFPLAPYRGSNPPCAFHSIERVKYREAPCAVLFTIGSEITIPDSLPRDRL